jgi:hypothetical protein
MPEREANQGTDLRQLVDEATQLQAGVNLFCARATAQRVTLPQSLIDAAAALLLLPEELRRAAERSEGHAAIRAGTHRANRETAGGGAFLRVAPEEGDAPCWKS